MNLNYQLNPNKKIAFIMSPRLGDAIIAMIIVYNIQQQGVQVDVYSRFLYMLKDWFPGVNIYDYPEQQVAKIEWKEYDLLLHTYKHDVLYSAQDWHSNVMVLDDDPIYNKTINMVDVQILVCERIFNIPQPVLDNGIQAPAGLRLRKHYKRVVIHPTASMKLRYWLPSKFICLAAKLNEMGFEPIFIVAPPETSETQWIIDAGLQRYIGDSFSAAAELIYESGWLIGCDSGLSHLASSLKIPTITLHQRRKVRLRWHPGFAANIAMLPCVNLIYKPWKERFWKYFITVGMVVGAFKRLVKRCHGSYPIK